MLSGLINVAIVLIGMFIGLSVVCSFVQEQIAYALQQRGATLYKGIFNLLAGHAALTEAVWNSTLVQAGAPGARKPSYVDARNFSLALWQSVQTTLGSDGGDKAAVAIQQPAAALATLIARVEAIDVSAPQAKNLQRSLASLLTTAENDYAHLLAITDQWFDNQMDRVAGWYKRWAQLVLIGIAVLVVIVSGVDTLDLAKQLYVSGATKNAADAIGAIVQKNGDATTQQAVNAATTQIAQAVDSQLRTSSNTLHVFHPVWQPLSDAARPTVSKALTAVRGAPAPPSPPDPYVEPPLGQHIFGMIITMIAVSLGAPFWFDVLKSVINVRMAGNKPDAPVKPAPSAPTTTVTVNAPPAAVPPA